MTSRSNHQLEDIVKKLQRLSWVYGLQMQPCCTMQMTQPKFRLVFDKQSSVFGQPRSVHRSRFRATTAALRLSMGFALVVHFVEPPSRDGIAWQVTLVAGGLWAITERRFGAITDSGPDVKWIANEGLNLKWEWCVSHVVNAATKMACGLTQKSYNLEMSELLNKLSQMCYDTSSKSSMGDLLKSLMVMLGKGNAVKVIVYKPYRFLGMAGSTQCVLDKWKALEAWYNEWIAKHIRARKRPPPGFPLAGHRQDLVQLLSVLPPIFLVTKRSYVENANQVHVLLSLYTARMTALSLDDPIRRHDTAPANVMCIQPYQFTALVANTRFGLKKTTFYHNFFRRYVDASYIASGSYIFEMQLMLHPVVKHVGGPMDEVVEVVTRTEGIYPRTGFLLMLLLFTAQQVRRLIANGLKILFDDHSGLQMTSAAPESGLHASLQHGLDRVLTV
ncbi:hypothetical protein P3T76_013027 [Phytophthora citrophthora]|uniref:Uncharacterized protein n=1 Tax=Phytophthora citrophthora TaxID=4793 RepID=A0AAD9L9M5_9STRA|nr:hypothetical protein P3T76_016196 [Phytophthora citrophthora]KAK1931698.1 hypothetical protein P3T76_013027 [Phytophthora citrophthora]